MPKKFHREGTGPSLGRAYILRSCRLSKERAQIWGVPMEKYQSPFRKREKDEKTIKPALVRWVTLSKNEGRGKGKKRPFS